MTRPQVRLDADVADLLAEAAEREHVSLSHQANAMLRHALRLIGTPGPGSARASAPASGCPHPRARVLDGLCTACGRRLTRAGRW